MRLYNKVQILKVLNDHLGVYPTPINLNWSWGWGSLSGILLGSQIVTGILLAMHYVGHVDHAFASVQHLMVDVPSGIILRYAHANGASLFFTVVYLHVLRGIYYSSGNQPREIVWISGVVIMLLMIITAFIGSLCSQKWTYPYCELLFINEESNLLLTTVFSLNNTFLTTGRTNQSPTKVKVIKKYFDLHLVETQLLIAKENQRKSAIYMVLNLKNLNAYVGSASSDKINTRFRSHCINNSGHSIILTRAIRKYGLNSFCFCILEYYPGFVQKENLNKNHIDLLKRETFYLELLKPEYNILTVGGSSLGYKHTEKTKDLMKLNYSQVRKDTIGQLNLNKKLSESTINKLSVSRKLLFEDKEYKANFLLKYESTLFKSKAIELVGLNNQLMSQFKSISETTKVLKVCNKTIAKHLKDPTKCFRKIGFFRFSYK